MAIEKPYGKAAAANKMTYAQITATPSSYSTNTKPGAQTANERGIRVRVNDTENSIRGRKGAENLPLTSRSEVDLVSSPRQQVALFLSTNPDLPDSLTGQGVPRSSKIDPRMLALDTGSLNKLPPTTRFNNLPHIPSTV